MLIRLEELVRVGGVFEESLPRAINPELVDSLVAEVPMPGYEGVMCRMQYQGQEEPMFVAGTFDSVLEKVNGTDEIVTKLALISQILA